MNVSCRGCKLGIVEKAWRVGSAKTSAVQGADANFAFNSADGVSCLKGFRVGIFIICPGIYFDGLFDHDEFRDVQHGPMILISAKSWLLVLKRLNARVSTIMLNSKVQNVLTHKV